MMSKASPIFKFGEIGSVDEYEKHLSAVFSDDLKYKILSESPLDFSCKFIKFDGLDLIKRRTSFKSFISLTLAEDVYSFDFSNDDQTFISNGALYDNKKQICFSKGSKICAVFPISERLILSVSREKIKEYLKKHSDCDIQIIVQDFNKYEVSKISKKNITNKLFREFNEVERLIKKNKLSDIYISDTEERIMSALTAYIVDKRKYGKFIKTKNRDRVLFRTLEYISETNLDDLSLPMLEEKVHASVRTIEYAFKTRLGITPKKYFNIVKLNRIRKDLLFSNAKTMSMNKIIEKYNIKNIGYFNTHYYSFFHEFPIETLNKNL